jgi:hypothetical protein
MKSLLPEGFEDLERFVGDWALPTEEQRLNRRLGSDMASILAFHDAIMPRLEAIFEHLDRYRLDALPEDAQRLLCMALSLAEIAPSVHFYKGPLPADVLDPRRFKRGDVPHMTPEI